MKKCYFILGLLFSTNAIANGNPLYTMTQDFCSGRMHITKTDDPSINVDELNARVCHELATCVVNKSKTYPLMLTNELCYTTSIMMCIPDTLNKISKIYNKTEDFKEFLNTTDIKEHIPQMKATMDTLCIKRY